MPDIAFDRSAHMRQQRRDPAFIAVWLAALRRPETIAARHAHYDHRQHAARVSATLRQRGTFQGEKHPKHVLTDDDVRDIRTSSESTASLARRYGVHYHTIRRARNRQSWSHVV